MSIYTNIDWKLYFMKLCDFLLYHITFSLFAARVKDPAAAAKLANSSYSKNTKCAKWNRTARCPRGATAEVPSVHLPCRVVIKLGATTAHSCVSTGSVAAQFAWNGISKPALWPLRTTLTSTNVDCASWLARTELIFVGVPANLPTRLVFLLEE